MPSPLHCWLLALLAVPAAVSGFSPIDTFYCDSPDRLNLLAIPAVRLVTRNQSASTYRPGSTCEFQVRSPPGSLLFVELLDPDGSGLGPGVGLGLSSGAKQLLALSSPPLPAYATSLVTPAGLLHLRLRVSATAPTRPGLTAVVRSFQFCPPGWVGLSNACYGTVGTGNGSFSRQLAFADGQLACNFMRSNLLTQAYGVQGLGGIDEMQQRLAGWSRGLGVSSAWIGLTDATDWGRFAYYWIDGGRFGEHSRIGCSSDSSASYRNCLPRERCGQMSWSDTSSSNPLHMSACATARPFLCAMPIGGTDRFDLVPPLALSNVTDFDSVGSAGSAWLWMVVLAACLVTGLMAAAVCLAVRYCAGVKPQRRLLLRGQPHQLQPPPPPPYSLVASPSGAAAPPPPPYEPRDLLASA